MIKRSEDVRRVSRRLVRTDKDTEGQGNEATTIFTADRNVLWNTYQTNILPDNIQF